MSTPQNSVWTLPKPQIGPQNQVDFKLDMKGALKMNIVQLYGLTPKQGLNLSQAPGLAHYGPKQSKMTLN